MDRERYKGGIKMEYGCLENAVIPRCPFNGKYVPIIEQVAKENNVPFRVICITTKEEAQSLEIIIKICEFLNCDKIGRAHV